MRWKVQSMARARAWPSVVLPTPGTPSMSRWPLAKMETRARRRTSSLPRMTRRRLASSSPARRAVAISVSGAIGADSTMRAAVAAVTAVIDQLSAVSSELKWGDTLRHLCRALLDWTAEGGRPYVLLEETRCGPPSHARHIFHHGAVRG